MNHSRKQRHDWRDNTPYGIWTCADGRQVLFNRRYRPIWQRTPDGKVSRADPGEWVPWKAQEWLYDDGTLPKERERRCLAMLKQWRIE
jgi:hypothetical protein